MKNENELKEKMERYSKIEQMKEEEYEMKSYLWELKMEDARMHFRLRTKMFTCKMNQGSDQKNKATLWQCTGCGNVDTQAHILWCPAYQDLRGGEVYGE